MSNDPILKALEILEETFSLSAPKAFLNRIKEYEDLVSTWNDYASLISPKDLKHTFSDHVADSLSLVPYILSLAEKGYVYLDVGSGGGFPAIPVKLFAPQIESSLIERKTRKASFLLKAIFDLNLLNIHVLDQSFPSSTPLQQPFVLTARAIEKPSVFLHDTAKILEHPSVFLRQSGHSPPTLPAALEQTPVDDVFDHEKLRRGRLYKVTSKNAS